MKICNFYQGLSLLRILHVLHTYRVSAQQSADHQYYFLITMHSRFYRKRWIYLSAIPLETMAIAAFQGINDQGI